MVCAVGRSELLSMSAVIATENHSDMTSTMCYFEAFMGVKIGNPNNGWFISKNN